MDAYLEAASIYKQNALAGQSESLELAFAYNNLATLFDDMVNKIYIFSSIFHVKIRF